MRVSVIVDGVYVFEGRMRGFKSWRAKNRPEDLEGQDG